jgi:hypothetical protein
VLIRGLFILAGPLKGTFNFLGSAGSLIAKPLAQKAAVPFLWAPLARVPGMAALETGKTRYTNVSQSVPEPMEPALKPFSATPPNVSGRNNVSECFGGKLYRPSPLGISVKHPAPSALHGNALQDRRSGTSESTRLGG